MGEERSTPRADGFSMPAEWGPHEACCMEWPTVTRKDFWGKRFEEAKRDYAEVANAIAAFEPVVMVCDPEQEAEARTMCTQTVEILPLPVDDSIVSGCFDLGCCACNPNGVRTRVSTLRG